ncbi:inhibitor of apoptosis repeat-containing protein [Dendrothele bispora CBS 962.96]|uniref:Inhibitor of apoptosis repeat-containing protein n=1 Tax=Dendrothele bispora (strain CBS 962.96) TaxID=1314807 RepID=A0A4S8LHY5_DENBC|nr:inhibitor of apoptosis repeat-containing protein [Dendrothele bispora CBS 962.96]
MHVLDNRINSFYKPKRKPGSKSQAFKWPHPEYFTANPETLAEAGFYYDPSPEDVDNVTCYMCGKELSEWAEEDDPFDIHFKKCGKKCSWASVRCGLRSDMNHKEKFVFTDKSRLPTSKTMEKARLETFTFQDVWTHDSVRNHAASSKNMARAGFVYNPLEVGDDSTTCLYCGIALSGWQDDDDPT